MDLLLIVGSYALWFILNVFFAVVTGFCLAWGFALFKDIRDWNKKRKEKKQVDKKNKEYQKQAEQAEQEMAAAAVATGAA